MKKNNHSGFTLVEILVVVVVLGILAGMALQNFSLVKKRNFYKSALAQVQAIAAAEKNYFLSMSSYVTTTGTANTNFVLGILVRDEFFYNYRVTAAAGTFTITADTGSGGSLTSYTFNADGIRTGCTGIGCITP